MSITKDQIIEAVAAMSVMDVVELISAMEEKFGVSAAAAVAVAAGPVEAADGPASSPPARKQSRTKRACSSTATCSLRCTRTASSRWSR